MRTKQYEFAERVTCIGVTVKIYDGRPYCPHPVVQVRCEVDEVEYGCEATVDLVSELTIGQVLDLALAELMKGIPDATKPCAPE